MARSTREVFDSHLALRKQHKVDEDIAQNYAGDVVLLTCTGRFEGHDGVRASANELHHYFPEGRYEYVLQDVAGDIAYLVWNGRSPEGEVHGCSDTFLIRGGKIVVQTIHYEVHRDQPLR